MKILKKEVIIKLLNDGAIIQYNTIYGGIKLLINGSAVGVVRFDTYLKLDLKLLIRGYACDYYILNE